MNRCWRFFRQYGYLLIPALASFFFFWRLGEASFTFDELVTANTVHTDRVDLIIRNYLQNHLHPPLYFLLLRFSVSFYTALTVLVDAFNIIGAYMLYLIYLAAHAMVVLPEIGDGVYPAIFKFYHLQPMNPLALTETGLRLLSAGCMTALIFTVMFFFKNRNLALVGAFFCVLCGMNETVIYYAQDARPYALLILLVALTTISFLNTYQKNFNFKNYRTLVVLNILLLLTHFFSVFVIFTELAVFAWANRQKNLKAAAVSLGGLLVSTVALTFFLIQVDLSRFTHLSGVNLETLLLIHKISFPVPAFWFNPLLIAAAVTAIIKFLLKKSSKAEMYFFNLTLWFALLLLGMYVVCLIRPIFNLRYATYLVPLELAAAGCALYAFCETAASLVKSERAKIVVLWTVFLLILARAGFSEYSYLFYYSDHFTAQKRYPLRQAYESVSADASQGQIPYVFDEYNSSYLASVYEERFGFKNILALDPHESYEKRISRVEKAVSGLPVFYMIKVSRDKQNTDIPHLPGFQLKPLFVSEKIRAYKFIKEN